MKEWMNKPQKMLPFYEYPKLAKKKNQFDNYQKERTNFEKLN